MTFSTDKGAEFTSNLVREGFKKSVTNVTQANPSPPRV